MIASCSAIPKIDEDLKSQLWFEHQIAITGINVWNLNGRLGIKNQKNSGTLSFLWEQSYADYELRFIAPLGQGTYILKMEPNAKSLPHIHTGYEEFLMLEGELIDLDGTIFTKGDFITFEPGSTHSSHTKDGCLILVFMRGINKPL